ncbi:equilibrative nucleobase transporter 1 isoform X1 [Hydra vulgaris]|nr:equilibrative nucleobase transporter 1-like [Hydra vulgaris]
MIFRDINSKLYQSIFFIYILLETLLISGIAYGWASIVVIFKDKKLYAKLCSSILHQNSTLIQNRMEPEILNCDQQDIMFNLIFTVSAICICAEFPIGILIDKFGAKKSRLVTGCFYAISCLGLGFVKVDYEDYLFPIFIGIVSGGAAQLISAYQMSNYIFSTKMKSLVICILAGAFDSSSVVLLLFKVVYEAGFTLKSIVITYTVVSFIMTFIGSLLLVPDKEKVVVINNQVKNESGNQASIFKSIFSLMYCLQLLVLTIIQLKLWYYVGSMHDNISTLTLNNQTQVSKYTNLFGYIQLGGIFVTPIVGLLFQQSEKTVDEKLACLQYSDKHIPEIRSSIRPFVVTIVLTLILCVLSLFADLRLEIPCYMLYTVVRGFLYANNAAFIGIAFPASQYGTLFGLNIFVSAALGFFQYALFNLTKYAFNGNSFWINTILLILVTICLIHPLYLFWYCKQTKVSLVKKCDDKKPLIDRTPDPYNETFI